MSPKKGKTLFKNLLSARLRLGCGCSDTRPNLPDAVIHPKPKPKPNKASPSLSFSSTSSDGVQTSTTFSPIPYDEPDKEKKKMKIDGGSSPNNKIEESVAVEKESEDPYEDFRDSMMQMIKEKEIYTQEDLHHLLRRFLRLNTPAHRPFILRAFVDVCHSLIVDVSHTHHSSSPM